MIRTFGPRHFEAPSFHDARLEWLRTKAQASGRVLNLGAKDTRLGSVLVDVDPYADIDVRADARCLPFRNGSFDTVLFSEVLEHLPLGSETSALAEISRVLAPEGRLILTTPASHLVYNLMDLAWYLGHRHYSITGVVRLLKRTGFRVERCFRGSGPGDALRNLIYQILVYPGFVPDRRVQRFLQRVAALQSPIVEQDSARGFIVFVDAVKN